MMENRLVDIKEKMQKALAKLQNDLATIRTGRATPALVESISVDYYGVPTPLNQLAGISVPEAQLLVIQPWDKQSLSSIEKSILKSELGLNPSNDGTVIRVPIPKLTEERRKELVRMVKKRVEEERVVVRNIRREAIEITRTLERNKEVSQDEQRRLQDQVQKLTDKFIGDIDRVGSEKEAELMEV
ncbi:MAG: ribosome recycling factor [Dehalococcoidia bacterium]